MAIGITQIATNAYAPDGAKAINLYSLGEAQNLTLSQMVAAICLQAADAYECQSVTRMNRMNTDVEALNRAAQIMQALADGTQSMTAWHDDKTFLENYFGITGLPAIINSYTERLGAAKMIGAALEGSTRDAQQDMIEVQSLISKRDVSYATSSNIVRALGASTQGTAANF